MRLYDIEIEFLFYLLFKNGSLIIAGNLLIVSNHIANGEVFLIYFYQCRT